MTLRANFKIKKQEPLKASFKINEQESIKATFKLDVRPDISDTITSIIGDDLIEAIREGRAVKLNSKTYIFEQEVSSNIWVIEHNLDKHPSIFVVDSANEVQIPDEITYNSNMKMTIKFLSEFSGRAFLN